MSKDMFKGIIGLLALGVYGGKFIYALFAYSNGDYERAALIMLVGGAIEILSFLYVMRD